MRTIAAGALSLLWAFALSADISRTGTIVNDDFSGDPGDGSLANGESRCDQLGAACFGAMSMTAVAYHDTGALGGGEFSENPIVQTSKQLTKANAGPNAGTASQFYVSGGVMNTDISVQTNCFGTSHRCVRILQEEGLVSVDATPAQITNLTGRVAARYYKTLSADYESTDIEGTQVCSNDKWIQLADYFTSYEYQAGVGGGYTSTNLGGFSPQLSSEGFNPGDTIRIEMVIERYSNTVDGAADGQMSFFYKNVTEGTAEQSFTVNTRLALVPANRDTTQPLHHYRAGVCGGSVDVGWVVLAHWASPVGNERICSAFEVEGVSGVC